MVFSCEFVLFSWIKEVAGVFPIVLPYSRGVVGFSREYASYLIANSFISSSESGRHSTWCLWIFSSTPAAIVSWRKDMSAVRKVEDLWAA